MSRSKKASMEVPPLIELINEYNATRERFLEQIQTGTEVRSPAGPEDTDELYREISLRIHEAIRRSGLSREQVVDSINSLFYRSNRCCIGVKELITISVLNNHLSASKPESRIPLDVLLGVCLVTDDFGPFEPLLSRGKRHIVCDRDRILSQLGQLDALQREVAHQKAELRRLLAQCGVVDVQGCPLPWEKGIDRRDACPTGRGS